MVVPKIHHIKCVHMTIKQDLRKEENYEMLALSSWQRRDRAWAHAWLEMCQELKGPLLEYMESKKGK